MKTTEKNGAAHANGKKERRPKWAALRAGAVSVALGVSAASGAVTTTFLADGGDWNSPQNWDNGVPGTNDTAIIGNGLTAVLNGAADGANTLTLGDDSGAGALILSNAVFSESIQFAEIGMVAGTTGILTQIGGLITNVTMRFGNETGATGSYTLEGGTNEIYNTAHFGANGGRGFLTMNGGRLAMKCGSTGKNDVLLGGGAYGSYCEARIHGGSFLISGGADMFIGHKENVSADVGFAEMYLTGGALAQAKNFIFGHARVFVENSTIDAKASNNSIYFGANNKTNSIEMVGGSALCIAYKQINFGSNTTVRVVLDETCATNTTYFRTTAGPGAARVSTINGTLRVARKDGCYRVPSSVVLFSSAAGGYTNEFQRVVWEDGLTGTVTYDTTAKEIRIENIVAPKFGTVIRIH